MLALFAFICGTTFAQEVTMDFTTNTWGFPETSKNKGTAAQTFTNGDYAIALEAATSGYYYNSNDGGYLMLGKLDATLTLPAFDFDVEMIKVTGSTNASAKVTQNIFVDGVAVSTETTGAKAVTNEYAITEASQAAGTVYVLKVTNANNTQIKKIEIFKKGSGEAGGEGEGGTTPEPETAKTLWSEAFSASQGDFTIEDKTLGEGLTYVWKFDTSYSCMKASGYSGGAKVSESWLVSPVLDMTKATEASLNFKHAGKFFGTMADEIKLMACVAEGAWTELAISAYPTNTDYTFVDATADLSAYVGKKMQFAFVYKSTAEKAGTYEVKDVAITGQGEVAVEAPEVPLPEYTSIAALKEAATATAAEMTFKFTDLLVTGIIGKSVYVTDGTDGLLIYGVAPTFKKGDKISGSIAGNIVLYNELTEITNPDFTNVTVSSNNNAVAAKVVTIAELLADGTDKYENVLIKLEEVSFNAAALSNRNVTITDAEDNEITVRDNFNVLTDYTFDTGKTYNVTAFVAQYKGAVQLYPGSADDLELITNLVDAEAAWAAEEVVILPGEEWNVNNAFTTKSDATVTYSSSNENVATVDAEGKVTVKGYGLAEITAETEENATYLAGKASFKLYVIEGEGTLEKPYSVADAQYYYEKVTEKVWVKGVIGGYYTNAGLVADITETPASNLALGTADCCIPVELKGGSDVRTALNLKDNPGKLNTTVWLYGNIEKYFNVAGLKNVTDFSLDGVITTGIEGVEAENGVKVIYDLSGRRVQQAQKGLYIINGKKVLVK